MLKLVTGLVRLSLGDRDLGLRSSTPQAPVTRAPTPTPPESQAPAPPRPTAAETVAVIKDALQFEAAGVLSNTEQKVVDDLLATSRTMGLLPDAEQLQGLKDIVAKAHAALGGELPESSEVQNVTKRFTLGSTGFGTRSTTDLEADKTDLLGQIGAARTQIEQLEKIKRFSNSESDQLKLGVQIAELEQQVATCEAKVGHIDAVILLPLARDPQTSKQKLAELADSPNAEVRLAVAEHPNFSLPVALKMMYDPDLRVAEAAYLNLPPNPMDMPMHDQRAHLAEHGTPAVRMAMAKDINTSGFVLEMLATDRDPAIATTARNMLASMLPQSQQVLFPNGDYADYMTHYKDARQGLADLQARVPQCTTLDELQAVETKMHELRQTLDRSMDCMWANASSVTYGYDKALTETADSTAALTASIAARRQEITTQGREP